MPIETTEVMTIQTDSLIVWRDRNQLEEAFCLLAVTVSMYRKGLSRRSWSKNEDVCSLGSKEQPIRPDTFVLAKV